MSYTEDFEAACKTFFANLAEEMDKYSSSMSSYVLEVQATGSTLRGIDVKFQVVLGSTYVGSESPKGISVRGVLTEAFRRKGWNEGPGSQKLLVKPRREEEVPDYSELETPF